MFGVLDCGNVHVRRGRVTAGYGIRVVIEAALILYALFFEAAEADEDVDTDSEIIRDSGVPFQLYNFSG